MTVLHELLAVEQDAVAVSTNAIDEGIVTFSKRTDHFLGQAQTVSYFAEERKGENISSSKEIVTTVDDKLSYILGPVSRLWDVKLQKDNANSTAFGDIIIDGKTIAEKVPAIFLLNMETHLKKVREVIAAIPTLEPAVKWDLDPNAGKGVYVAPATAQMRTEKILDHKILVPATDKHPAQVEKWTADTPVARVETVKYSGAWPVSRKSKVLSNLDKLMDAIKTARQRANLVEVPKVNVGKALTDFILS